jgi:hypothetical protein
VIRKLLLAAPLVLAAACAQAADVKAGDLVVKDAVMRPTPGGSTNTSAFLTVENGGKAADTLVSVSCGCAAKVELHEMSMAAGGVMRMRALPQGLAVPAGGSAALKPGGSHVMVMGLKAPLVSGQTVPMTLTFAKAGKVTVPFKVTAAMGGHGH